LAPGHTPGTLAFFFDVTDGQRVKRAGCWGGIGAFTVYKAHNRNFGLPEDMCDRYIESAQKLKAEHVDIHLGNHTGDNRALEKCRQKLEDPASEPFVNSDAWVQFLEKREDWALRFREVDD